MDDFFKVKEAGITKVLVTTFELGGTGYDGIKAASHMVIFNISSLALDEEQAIGRVCRAGQRNRVHVFRLVDDAVDQIMLSIREKRLMYGASATDFEKLLERNRA